ncbi:hypothetical protein Scep_026171 [Stephania cephalantha]|uniref:Reverse transcriptase domain-containing protein n=1 Tax=Stephania cephalantha TaxID=152367 RepID=A0AAP0EMU7_9MAGN
MHPKKSPSADGMMNKLLQQKWSLFREDVLELFRKFHSSGHLEKNLNESLVVLIPKKSFLQALSDFCPISLCNSIYKLLAKVLSNRLKVVLYELISPFQNAFVASRQISDNILLAHEILHSMGQSNRRSQEIILKLDIAKAYDKLRCGMIGEILNKMGFSLNGVARFIATYLQCHIMSSSMKTYPRRSYLREGLDKGTLYPPSFSFFVQKVYLSF